MKKKIVAFILVFALALALGIGGTLAWLTAESGTVTNTFTIGKIEITLAETTEDEYKIVPGWSYEKDPTVTVLADSEACWLFVEVTESDVILVDSDTKAETKMNFDDFLTYSIVSTGDKKWTPGDGTNIPANVYYQKVAASTTAQEFPVLTDDEVSVPGDTVTMSVREQLKAAPTLAFKAYAVQLYETNGVEFEAAEAWAKINH